VICVEDSEGDQEGQQRLQMQVFLLARDCAKGKASRYEWLEPSHCHSSFHELEFVFLISAGRTLLRQMAIKYLAADSAFPCFFHAENSFHLHLMPFYATFT
jgi:hypothetical protein